ncbi:MAG: ankyrin repeat domain-containing protein, partial [Terracidiphilus sp.]
MPGFAEELYDAAGKRDANEVQRLLGEGAEVNARTRNDETALHGAAIRGRTEVAELLLSSGAEVSSLERNKTVSSTKQKMS